MSYFDRIARCNQKDLTDIQKFVVAGQSVGWIKPSVFERIKAYPEIFLFENQTIILNPKLTTCEERTDALARVVKDLYEEEFFPRWVDEPFKIATSWAAPTLATIERAAAQIFGIVSYGIHLNGYVRDGDQIKMWVGHRAKDRLVQPGKLDQLMAGGQPEDLTLEENLVKECKEEAGMSAELALQARPIGAMSYAFDHQHKHGLRRDVLFNYDLELSPDFIPHCTDGEQEEFYLWPLEQVAEIVHDTEDFKYNCAMVVIDFLIRHGYIKPDHPEYEALVSGLHQDVRP
ncbi:MAG: DUF4743 domain-containing protein [Alphaproteobacteria bacterium]|nr:DUF4743 domain-containing protein [Rhodospirillales bacterium]MCW9045611.1 DUF4743 domain-containing protein [Alphaproteobacteria bacterium]